MRPVLRSGLRLLGQAVALALLLAACSGGSGQQDAGESASALERIRESGRVRIGYADEAPFAYMDSARSHVTGEAPEVAREVLRRLGVRQVEAVLTEFGSLIPGLNAGRFDIIAAGSVFVERARPFEQPVIDGKPVRGYGAFGFRKGDSDLVAAFNQKLAEFIGTPEHRNLVRQFGFTGAELPGAVTAEELCRG